jgi:hypothetical protein
MGMMLATMIAASSCAPKPTPISRGATTPPSGPRYEDVDLKVDGMQAVSPLDFSADVTAAVIFRMTENLFAIRDSLIGQPRADWAQGILQGVPQMRTKLIDSPYTALLMQQSEDMARKELATVVPELKASPAKVRAILAAMPPAIGPKDKPPIDATIALAFKYLREFDQRAGASDMHGEIKKGIHSELQKIIALEARAQADLKVLANAKTIKAALSSVVTATKDLSINIPKSTQPKLDHGRSLAARVDAIADAHTALAALIEVWIFLSPEGRISNFKAASAELYDYLNGMSTDDLRCLQDTDCSSVSKWIARKLVIEPKIDDYGIVKIRTLLNDKGAAEVRGQVRDAVIEEIRGLAKLIGDEIEAKLLEKMAPIVRLQGDFNGEIKARLEAWAAKNFEANGPSVTTIRPARAHLNVNPNGKIDIAWSQMPSNTIENTGAFDGLAPVLWKEAGLKSESVRGLVLAKIATLARQYRSGPGNLPADAQSVSARAYAEVIRGLAGLANSFKEWQTSPIDDLIGSAKAKDLFPEFAELPELDQPLFPKAAFYALSFHGLSENLQSVQSDRTQVFLIDANNRIVRANESPSEETAPMIMAGIADRNGTELSPTVRAEDVARYLLAMCDVYEATKDVERTTSDILLKADKDGNIPRDQILASREKIRLLILGLANFLSHQFRAGGELIRRELVIATQQPFDLTIAVMDQALAIRALVAASDTLGNDVYRWEAADLVTSMNRNLYRADLGFYARPDEKSISPVVLLETIRALDAVGPYLGAFSRRQVDKVTQPWRTKISSWRLQTADSGTNLLPDGQTTGQAGAASASDGVPSSLNGAGQPVGHGPPHAPAR